MNARALLSRCWLACVLGAFPGLASAVDCPAEETHPGWPETSTPTGTMSETASGYCAPATAHVSTGINTTTYNTPAAFAARLQVIQPTYTSVNVFISPTHGAPPAIDYCVTWVTGAGLNRGTYLRLPATATPCDPPEEPSECDANVTESWDEYGTKEGLADNYPPGSCVGGCEVESSRVGGHGICVPGASEGCGKNGLGAWTMTVHFTGEDCGGGDPLPEETTPLPPDDAPPEKEYCRTTAAGTDVCEGPYGENCGYINDQFVCLGKTDDDECWINPDGSRWCGDSAPMPPVPDSGTRGDPAEPDDQVVHEGDTHNYYDGDTVTNSDRDPTDNGANPNRPGSNNPSTGGGDGDGEGDDDEGESASGGGNCDAAPSCDGDPIACAILTQEWKARCPDEATEEDLVAEFGPTGEGEGGDDLFGSRDQEIELPEAFASGGWLGSSACPDDITIELGGDLPTVTVPVSTWCEWMQLIGVLIMVSAYIGGIKIVIGGI